MVLLKQQIRQDGAVKTNNIFKVAIEKGYQLDGKSLRERGYQIESLAIIESMNPQTNVVFFQ